MNSEPFFQEIFQESPVPSVILRADPPYFRIIEVNRSFLTLTRRRGEDLLDKGFFECGYHISMATNVEMMEVVRESLDQVVREKKLVRSPIQQYTQPPVGAEPSMLFYLQATNKPVLDENNEIRYIIRTLKDVTEAVAAQIREHEINEMLSDNEQFLKETQTVAKIGSWQIDRDNEVKWSEIHHRIFETEEGFQPRVENSVHFFKNEKDTARLWEVINEAKATGKPFDEEFEIITAKGNWRWLRFSGKGELRNGEFVRLYGTTQDISSRKMLELQLLESRNHFEDIIHNIQGVIWEADPHTLRITFISDKVYDMLGYTKEECLGSPEFWHSHLHPEDKEEVISQTQAKVKACANFSFEYRMRKKDGSYIWVLDSFAVAENGLPIRLRGLMIDITRTKLTMELEHLERKVLELNSSSRVSLEKVLEFYVQGIEAMFPQIVCSIMKIKQGLVHNWVAPSLPPSFKAAIDKEPIGEQAGSCGTAAFRKDTVIVSDIATDPLWDDYRELALSEGLHASWSHPILSSEGEVLATLAMYYRKVKAPTEDELKVVARTASILTVIIEHRQNSALLFPDEAKPGIGALW